ncbi:cation transporter [Escherichia coli]|nr:cation transporter [Escherichia coli]
MLVEVIGGFLSGSLALLADAGHMLTDTAALLFALLAVQFSRRPPTICPPHFRLVTFDHARGVCECHRPGGDYYFDCLGGDRTLPALRVRSRAA